MTKKQILATCLAGALTLGCISGCSAKKQVNQESENTILEQEDEIKAGYYVNTIMATPVYNANRQIEYYIAPDNSFIVKGNLAYQVIYRRVVEPIKHVDENGNIDYSLPSGGILCGTIGYQDRVVTDASVAEEVLTEYLENKDAIVKTYK